jgi:hypothetical protein
MWLEVKAYAAAKLVPEMNLLWHPYRKGITEPVTAITVITIRYRVILNFLSEFYHHHGIVRLKQSTEAWYQLGWYCHVTTASSYM